jgi:hypothetical protein
MKRLLTLLALSIAGLPLASAQETFTATSGSMVVHSGAATANFSVAGTDFSMSGMTNFGGPGGNPFDFPVGNYPFQFHIADDTSDGGLGFSSLSVRGVPWSVEFAGGGGFLLIDGSAGPFPAPGTYSGKFTFSTTVVAAPASVVSGNPGAECAPPPEGIVCTELLFSGGGNLTLDVVPYHIPLTPPALEIAEATFIFKPSASAPEPSTASLLLIGFAGLAVIGGRRRPRAT